MCVCIVECSKCYISLGSERAISKGQKEKDLITTVIYVVPSVYKGLSHARLHLILTLALWKVILSFYHFIWEKLKFREVR